jgi:agmatine deiminase
MITDRETNTIYFSDLLASSAEYEPAFNRLANRLKEFKIPVKTVNRTSDMCVRDFLPVQVKHNRLVQFSD